MSHLSTQTERHIIDKHLVELNICDKQTAADESLGKRDKMADIIVNQKLKGLPFLINSMQSIDLTNPIKLFVHIK